MGEECASNVIQPVFSECLCKLESGFTTRDFNTDMVCMPGAAYPFPRSPRAVWALTAVLSSSNATCA